MDARDLEHPDEGVPTVRGRAFPASRRASRGGDRLARDPARVPEEGYRRDPHRSRTGEVHEPRRSVLDRVGISTRRPRDGACLRREVDRADRKGRMRVSPGVEGVARAKTTETEEELVFRSSVCRLLARRDTKAWEWKAARPSGMRRIPPRTWRSFDRWQSASC